MKVTVTLACVTLFFSSLSAVQKQQIIPAESSFEFPEEPWLTGPLLSPTPVNMLPGHPSIEPSVTILAIYGDYDSNWNLSKSTTIWSINPFIDYQMGFTDYLGLEIQAGFFTNIQNGKSSTHLQDTSLLFGYQVSTDDVHGWTPDFRIIIQEVFPTGKYQKFNPQKAAIEGTGEGAFQTGPLLAFQKLFLPGNHFLHLRWSLALLFPTHHVHVKGFNAYGGGFHTSGKVRPGVNLIAFFSGEYSLNKRWAFAFDTQFLYRTRSKFSGKKGFNSDGTVASAGLPSSLQLSFAPELEYNFSEKLGIIWGVWGTLLGRNAQAFAGGFFSVLYTF